MTPEQMLERVRACIAEAGYDAAEVAYGPDGSIGWFVLNSDDRLLYIWWKALALSRYTQLCWPCKRAMGVTHFGDPLYGISHKVGCGHPVDPFVREDAEAVNG
jgi:hypothetical protein